jgi:zinc transporter
MWWCADGIARQGWRAGAPSRPAWRRNVAVDRLHGELLSWMDDPDRLTLREITDRLVRHIEDLDTMRERAPVVQEQVASRQAEQLHRRMYVLSIVATVFLPLGFLSRLLGVNVGGLPGAEYPWAFPISSGLLIAVVGVPLCYFRKKDWL